MTVDKGLDSLFQPLCLPNKIRLNNRVVMAPMTRNRSDEELHLANDLMTTYYAQRASAGLIITEGTFVSPRAAGYINVPGIYTQKQIKSWKKVTKTVHKKDGKMFMQLWHTGRISHPDFHEGQLPLAPSAVNSHFKCYTPSGFQNTVIPKAMTKSEIKTTISDFKKAAENAIEAGFDGVELHAANGYLFHQFLAACANRRQDDYGGNIRNRCRFLLQTIDAVAMGIGMENVGVRLNPGLDNSFGITKDSTTRPTFDELVKQLNSFNLAYLHLSGFSKSHTLEPRESLLAEMSHFRDLYTGLLMINKGFNAKTATDALNHNIADMVSFGLPFIANPDLVKRFQNNLALNAPDKKTFYAGGANGYIDYPFSSS